MNWKDKPDTMSEDEYFLDQIAHDVLIARIRIKEASVNYEFEAERAYRMAQAMLNERKRRLQK